MNVVQPLTLFSARPIERIDVTTQAGPTSPNDWIIKVPAVTLVFWLMKIAATTLGETGGDAVSMSLNLGYLVGSAIFAVLFVLAVSWQVSSRAYHPLRYWVAIVASTTVGTTMADFATRSLGIGYAGGSLLLLALLGLSLFVWHRTMGSIAVASIRSTKAQVFYWMTIMFSQTLGTAVGDWTADTAGVGYSGGMLIFGTMLAILLGLYLWTRVSRTFLFWTAFILTRPLGAVIGDFLDKPISHGGLALDRFAASGVLIAFLAACLLFLPQRPARSAH